MSLLWPLRRCPRQRSIASLAAAGGSWASGHRPRVSGSLTSHVRVCWLAPCGLVGAMRVSALGTCSSHACARQGFKPRCFVACALPGQLRSGLSCGPGRAAAARRSRVRQRAVRARPRNGGGHGAEVGGAGQRWAVRWVPTHARGAVVALCAAGGPSPWTFWGGDGLVAARCLSRPAPGRGQALQSG